MSDITIVTDDAERLVREGGVINRDRPPTRRERYRYQKFTIEGGPTDFEGEREVDVAAPFTAEVKTRIWEPMHEWDAPSDRLVGTVRVVDVHHAKGCELTDRDVEVLERIGRSVGWDYCHPDAELDKWHMVVVPIGDANE